MNADELTTPARCRGAGVGGGFDRADIAANDCRHETRIDFLPADEDDVRGFYHRVGGFDHTDQPARFDHSEGVADIALLFVRHAGRTVSRRSFWGSGEQSEKFRFLNLVAGKDRGWVSKAEVPDDGSAKDVAEVGGD